jgi:amino acid transporter
MERAKKFGTFGGVYTPALLTILGVIMYLRLGWVVGQAGLISAIAIILVAHIISITTGLSLSSIATDKKIKAGGIYYMLSRSLGLPMGGAIGATIFLATALSISFYLVGFSESFLAVDSIRTFFHLEQDPQSIRLVSSVVLMIIIIIALISTSLAIKVQYFVMTAIGLSLFSVVAGFFIKTGFHPALPSISPMSTAPSMDVLFAIFFPAVTGFTVGVAMSGDLRDPKASIPKGTLLAIFTGLVIYVGLAVCFAFFVDRDLLLNDSSFLIKIAFIPLLVIAGIWGATLSSALGGILGGPRILQALAKDKLAPFVLSKGFGINNEPRIALLLTFIIAQGGILIGDLNAIARVVTMFFITAYAFINLAFALESWASSDFRPSFKIPRWVGWLGFAASFVVMMQIDFAAMLIAFMLIWLTWYVMKRRDQTLEPGDVWQSVWANIIRQSIHKLYAGGIEERNWKPNIMLFTGNPANRPQLTELGKALIANHGLLTSINLQLNKDPEHVKPRFQQKQTNGENMIGAGVFVREYACNDIYDGIENLAETYGFAGVEPNTVLMGWAGRTSNAVRYAKMIKYIIGLDLNILLMDYDAEKGFGKRKQIDIWWRGSGNNGNLAINLVKFLWLSEGWKESRLRLMIENPINDERENICNFAQEVLDNLRVNGEIIIINNEIEKKPFYDLIRIESGDSDIVFMGLPDIEEGKELEFVEETHKLCADLGTVVLIKASTQFKRLNIGLKNTAAPLLAPLSESIPEQNKALEAALVWPNNPQLTTPLKDFATQIHELNRQTTDKGFGKILNQYAEILASAHNRINTTFAIIEKRIGDNSRDNKDTIRAFFKLTSNSFARYEQILNNLKAQTIVEQQRNLEIYFESFEHRAQEILAKLPEKIDIVINRQQIISAPDNSPGSSTLKRVVKWNGGKDVKLKVRFQQIIRRYYPRTWFYTRKRLWQKFNLLSRQYISEQQKVFRDFLNSLRVLENALYNSTLTPEMINREKQKIDVVFTELKEFLIDSKSTLYTLTGEEDLNALSKICHIMSSLNPNAMARRHKQPAAMKRNVQRSMQLYPSDWEQVQQLLVNQSLFETTLAEVDYKLWHFCGKFNQELLQIRDHTDQPLALNKIPAIRHFLLDNIELLRQEKPTRDLSIQAEADKELARRTKEIEDALQERVNLALSRLPSHVDLLKPHAETDFTQSESLNLKQQTVEVSRLLHYTVQSNLLTPLQSILRDYSKQSKQTENELLEIIRLIKITLNLDREEPLQMALDLFLEEQLQLLDQVHERINSLFVSTNDKLQGALNKTSRQLSLSSVLKTAENLRLLEKSAETRKQKSSWIVTHWEKTRDILRKNLVKVWFDRSKRIVYAGQRRLAEADTSFPISQLHALNEAVSAKAEVLASIPPYYQQLFLRKNNYFMDFWHGKPRELEEAAKTIARHERGFNGALLITGEHNSGKTFFVNYIVNQYLEKRQIFTVTPPFAGSANEAEFVRALQKTTESYDSVRKTLETIPEKSVIIIEDLELWWEKTIQGLKVIKLICELVAKYGDRVLFIITANSHAYKSINRFVKVDSYMLSTIDCKPFNAEELKNIVMQRHRSGNIQFLYKGKKESEMRSWDFARLFNTYFNYTRGNVGLCLQTWMANIERSDGTLIKIKTPQRPDTDVLNKLNPETLVFLVQFILHKRLNYEKIQRIMLMPLPMVKEKVKLLKRAAIIIEHNAGVYTLNPNLHAFIRERFIEKELL